jgi:hypothetical protein
MKRTKKQASLLLSVKSASYRTGLWERDLIQLSDLHLIRAVECDGKRYFYKDSLDKLPDEIFHGDIPTKLVWSNRLLKCIEYLHRVRKGGSVAL